MKLLFVIPSITNYFTFLEDLIDELTSRGHEIHLATSRKHIARISAYRRDISCTVHHIDFPRAINPIGHLRAAQKVQKLVEELQPSLINIHFSAALFTTMLGKKKNWPPTTGTIHGLGSPLITGPRKRLIAFAEKWSTAKVDEVYVLTKDDETYLKAMNSKATVRVISSFGMGCDLKRFHPDAVSRQQRASLAADLGIDAHHFVYIFIGRQTNFKGFDRVIEAFLETKKERPNSKLILVGEKDRIHPTALRKPLEKALKEDPDIIAVGWQENVPDYLALAHVNVFPSDREGLPVNLMESLAMGVPVITVDSRGCRDVVRDQMDGFVVKQGDRLALVREMLRLQNDSKLLGRMQVEAVAGRQRFDRQLFMDEQFSIYSRLTGRPV